MQSVNRPFLSLRDASFRLGENLVFENTSWTYHHSQQWAVVGGNGSGKSLFVDALRGFLPIVHGEMKYHFRVASGQVPADLIGHTSFEQRKFDLHESVVQSRWNSLEDEGAMRVRDFLSYERVMEVNPFEITDTHRKARPAFNRRMRRAISLLQVTPFLDRLLISLSNGEMQKVQLARALSRRMRLLILDEPFAGLDAASRAHFHNVLERLMGTPLKVLLLVTRTEDLPRHITHLLHIDKNRVIAAGPRSKVPAMPPARTRIPTLPSPGKIRRRPIVPGKELVRMRNVTVRYGHATILRDVNWTIQSGESWALSGPNGSGKTTLLSLILGDNPQVYINDITVFGKQRGGGESMWEIKKRIGWFSPELHQHFDDSATCFEVVASGFHDTIGLFQPPTPRQRTAARRLLAQFDLLESSHSPLGALSTGLQRMVLLMRALVKKPSLLILDEPCQGLDFDHREVFLKSVERVIQSLAITVIFVTHRPDEIPPSITRCLRLSAGRATVQASAPEHRAL